jgi:hypothetical protein
MSDRIETESDRIEMERGIFQAMLEKQYAYNVAIASAREAGFLARPSIDSRGFVLHGNYPNGDEFELAPVSRARANMT